MQLNFKISKQKLNCLNPTPIVSGSVNSVVTKFNFDSDWSDLNKIVYFTNENTKVTKEIVLENKKDSCYIPWEDANT